MILVPHIKVNHAPIWMEGLIFLGHLTPSIQIGTYPILNHPCVHISGLGGGLIGWHCWKLWELKFFLVTCWTANGVRLGAQHQILNYVHAKLKLDFLTQTWSFGRPCFRHGHVLALMNGELLSHMTKTQLQNLNNKCSIQNTIIMHAKFYSHWDTSVYHIPSQSSGLHNVLRKFASRKLRHLARYCESYSRRVYMIV